MIKNGSIDIFIKYKREDIINILKIKHDQYDCEEMINLICDKLKDDGKFVLISEGSICTRTGSYEDLAIDIFFTLIYKCKYNYYLIDYSAEYIENMYNDVNPYKKKENIDVTEYLNLKKMYNDFNENFIINLCKYNGYDDK